MSIDKLIKERRAILRQYDDDQKELNPALSCRVIRLYRDVVSDVEAHLETVRGVSNDLHIIETLDHVMEVLNIVSTMK